MVFFCLLNHSKGKCLCGHKIDLQIHGTLFMNLWRPFPLLLLLERPSVSIGNPRGLVFDGRNFHRSSSGLEFYFWNLRGKTNIFSGNAGTFTELLLLDQPCEKFNKFCLFWRDKEILGDSWENVSKQIRLSKLASYNKLGIMAGSFTVSLVIERGDSWYLGHALTPFMMNRIL